MTIILLLTALLAATAVSAQNKIEFTFSAGNGDVVLNDMRYTSARGLKYSISQCQYFVSDITIKKHNGTICKFPGTIHYVDIEIPSTLTWLPANDFTLENADSLYFTFGLDSIQNRSYRFKNPPENMMFWPDYLGGGYHYMKTNILYIAPDGQYSAFNCHIGRGQVYNAQNEPISFIENSQRIAVAVHRNKAGNATINLNISAIFDTPTPTLFTDYRGIMNNQTAMHLFSGNIAKAFSATK